MRRFIAALFVSGMVSAPALGGDARSALREFGLLGKWSPDCSIELSRPRASRVTFAAPIAAAATATIQENRDGIFVTAVNEITEAEMVAGGKIRIAFHPVSIVQSDGKATSNPHAYDNFSLVFQKAGKKIQLIRVQFEGLPEVQRENFFEKCLD
jgi:hypothetical protein